RVSSISSSRVPKRTPLSGRVSLPISPRPWPLPESTRRDEWSRTSEPGCAIPEPDDTTNGRKVLAGPAAAEAGAAAAVVVAATARELGDGQSTAQAVALGVRLRRLALEDAAAYAAAVAAFPAAAPARSDERRDFALGTLLERAADVPLAIAEACADVALLARAIAANESAHSADLEASARIAAGAARAAAHLVEINLTVRDGDARADRARAAVEVAG